VKRNDQVEQAVVEFVRGFLSLLVGAQIFFVGPEEQLKERDASEAVDNGCKTDPAPRSKRPKGKCKQAEGQEIMHRIKNKKMCFWVLSKTKT
jgi:hypothetical protein